MDFIIQTNGKVAGVLEDDNLSIRADFLQWQDAFAFYRAKFRFTIMSRQRKRVLFSYITKNRTLFPRLAPRWHGLCRDIALSTMFAQQRLEKEANTTILDGLIKQWEQMGGQISA